MELVKDLGLIQDAKQKNRYGIYQCPTCTVRWKVRTSHVTSGAVKHCKKCSASTHGFSKSKLYAVWNAMKGRCLNSKDINYALYGGRGITIYEEWVNDFVSYKKYVESLPDAMRRGYSIDREDNNKGYEPGNVRWITQSLQCINKRHRIGKSGYCGVQKTKSGNIKYDITVNRKRIIKSGFKTVKDAAIARDEFIILNKLEHQLNILSA